MNLIEKITEITANSVSPEEFKETWGYTIGDHVADMMDRVRKLEGKEAPVERVASERLRPVVEPAASAAEVKKGG